MYSWHHKTAHCMWLSLPYTASGLECCCSLYAENCQVLTVLQSNKSNLWLQHQLDADVQALSASTAALQPLFLDIAQLEPNSSSTAPAESVSAGNNSDHDSAHSTSTHGIHQANSSSSQVAEHDRNDQERQLSWTSTSTSLRRVLQTLQNRGLLGAGVSTQQALQAFQNACYAGCQAEEAG